MRPALRFVFTACLAAALSSFTAAIGAAAPGPDDDWTVVAPADAGLDGAKLAALDRAVTDGTFKQITSVLVVRDGQLAHEAYFNGGSREQRNDMRSATKTVTALLVGAAIDRGKIAGVDAKVYDFFKDRRWQHADARKAQFTLEDLLTMSTRWECNDENQFSTGNEERMYVTEDWTQFVLDLPMRGYAPWDTKPEDAPHGRAFSYCTAASYLLGVVVERATGMRLDRFAREALEQPLGIGEVQWHIVPGGSGMGGGGTRYTSRDVARIGELLRNDGEWRGRRVISAAWVKAMMTPRAVPREHTGYGYQIWHLSFERDGRREWAWSMSGNGGNYVLVMPERQLVAVITSQAYNQGIGHVQSQAIFRDYILASITD